MTEIEIIDGCREGNRNCQRLLYEKYASKMLALCYRYVGNRDTANDLLHDGFIQLFSHIKDYKSMGSFEGWIRRIFVTTTLGYLRKENRFTDDDASDAVWRMDENQPSAIDILSDMEVVEKINKLPLGYRTVLNLYAIEGYSHKEIGEQLGISEVTSRSQFLRAKNMLKTLLSI